MIIFMTFENIGLDINMFFSIIQILFILGAGGGFKHIVEREFKVNNG